MTDRICKLLAAAGLGAEPTPCPIGSLEPGTLGCASESSTLFFVDEGGRWTWWYRDAKMDRAEKGTTDCGFMLGRVLVTGVPVEVRDRLRDMSDDVARVTTARLAAQRASTTFAPSSDTRLSEFLTIAGLARPPAEQEIRTMRPGTLACADDSLLLVDRDGLWAYLVSAQPDPNFPGTTSRGDKLARPLVVDIMLDRLPIIRECREDATRVRLAIQLSRHSDELQTLATTAGRDPVPAAVPICTMKPGTLAVRPRQMSTGLKWSLLLVDIDGKWSHLTPHMNADDAGGTYGGAWLAHPLVTDIPLSDLGKIRTARGDEDRILLAVRQTSDDAGNVLDLLTSSLLARAQAAEAFGLDSSSLRVRCASVTRDGFLRVPGGHRRVPVRQGRVVLLELSDQDLNAGAQRPLVRATLARLRRAYAASTVMFCRTEAEDEGS